VTFKSKAQNISNKEYEIKTIHEDFNNYTSLYFENQANQDNYIKIESKDLFLIRKNKQTPYLILAKHNPLKNFILKTELRIGPTENKRSSIGIILKAEKNGNGGIIFEINRSGEYKISYQNVNTDIKQKGWEKSKLINGVDKLNAIEIRSENNVYDIYVNNQFLVSVNSISNQDGINGLFISSDTKAKVSYFYINTKQKESTYNNTIAINKLNQTINTLQKENTQLKATIKTFSRKDIELHNNESANQDQKIVEFKQENTLLETNQKNKKEKLLEHNNDSIEIMIQQDFQSNGIKPSEMIKRTSQVKVSKIEPSKIYSVQIGVFMKEIERDVANNFWSITTKSETYIYYSGKFNSSNEAVSHLNSLILKGYKNAFVITQNK
jgi:hypothetical protein